MKLTSSRGQPVERRTACDCSIKSFNNLSLISANWVGLFLKMVILSVTTDVSSPSISLTEASGFSEIFSNGKGFQFFMMIAPDGKENCLP